VRREAIDFPEVVALKGQFTIGGVNYSDIVIGTGAADDIVQFNANVDKTAMNIKLYSDGVEIIKANSVTQPVAARTPDIDLAGAKGVVEVRTDLTNAVSEHYVNYINADTSTTFVLENAETYVVARVRFDGAGANSNDTAQFAVSGMKSNGTISTGDIDDVEHIVYDLRDGNEGGKIIFTGPSLDTVTVKGNYTGDFKFEGSASGFEKFDASQAKANISFSISTSASIEVIGGSGHDVLKGGAGNDIINGGAGNDALTGGAGADRFVFDGAEFGNDTIADFVVGTDILDLSAYVRGDVSFSQNGANTDVIVGDAGKITLIGVNAGALEAAAYPA